MNDTQIATQLATRLLDDAPERNRNQAEIGKDVGNFTREFFVVCEAGEAMRQQLEQIDQPFVVLHGLADAALPVQLLQGISQLTGWPVRRLVIRRQGFGNELATLSYMDCPAGLSRSLRLYASEPQALAPTVLSLRSVLLGRAALTAVLVGTQAGTDLAGAFTPLRDLYTAQPPAGRGTVVVPMAGRSDELTREVDTLRRTCGLQAEIAPATADPALVWALLATAWNRTSQSLFAGHPEGPLLLNQIRLPSAPRKPAGNAAAPTTSAGAPAQRTPVAAAAAAAAPDATAPLDTATRALAAQAYLTRAVQLCNARAACVFDTRSMQVVVHAGPVPAETLARQGLGLISTFGRTAQSCGATGSFDECCAVLGDHHLMLRRLPQQPTLAVLVLVPVRTPAGGPPPAWQQGLRELAFGPTA